MTHTIAHPTLFSLQIGRGIAAIAVAVHHAMLATHSLLPASVPDVWYKLCNLGYLGVDYFFVLSGFIIAHVTRTLPKNAQGLRYYAMARAIRIYLPYLPLSLAMVTAFAWIPGLSLGDREGFSTIASLTLLPASTPPALSVAWTLQHEIVFYVMFALCCFLLKQPRLIFLWALPIVLLRPYALPQAWAIPFGAINLEFLLGVAACEIFHTQRISRHQAKVVALLGVGFVVMASAMLLQDSAPPELRLLAGLGFAMMVLGGATLERYVDFRRFHRLIAAGAASYAIYLVHNPAISVLLRCIGDVASWPLVLLLFSIASCSAGFLYYRLFEKPLLRLAQQRLLRRAE